LNDRTARSAAEAAVQFMRAATSRHERATRPEHTGGSPLGKPLAHDAAIGGRTAVEQAAISRMNWRYRLVRNSAANVSRQLQSPVKESIHCRDKGLPSM
jgi:hypothetical protein